MAHVRRGACKCGQCIDAVENPEQHQPTGHTVDLVFFSVLARDGADAATLKRLVTENKQGSYCDIDLLDGKEHHYMEVGAWIGSQELGLMLMGLGTLLGLWELLTPKSILGDRASRELEMRMAQQGFVMVKAKA